MYQTTIGYLKGFYRSIPIIIMVGLITLRFPFLFAAKYNIIKIPQNTTLMIFGNITYLLSAVLIIYERKRLSNFNIDIFSIFLFIGIPILTPFMNMIIRYFNPLLKLNFSIFQIVLALLLCVFLIVFPPKLDRKSFKKIVTWFFISIVIGLIISIIFAYLICRQKHVGFVLRYGYELPLVLSLFMQQIRTAAISEEPLFRGFIWGYLNEKKWKWHWIWIFQTLLFMIAHLYYVPDSLYSFFLIVPISGLILGYIAGRSKSIGNSMICHGLINSVSSMIALCGWW